MFGFQSHKETTSFEQELNLDGIQFNDDDLNDPDLLAELAAMTMESAPKPSSKKEVKVVKQVETVDVDVILASIPAVKVEEDVHVELTEEDMNDPHLLAELQAVSGVPEDPASLHDHIEQPEVAEDTVPVIPEETELSLEYKLKSTNISVLSQYVQLEKIKALQKKRGGDRSGAMEHLRAAKELEKRIQDCQLKDTQISSKPSSPVKTALEEIPTPKKEQIIEKVIVQKEIKVETEKESLKVDITLDDIHLDLVDSVEMEERSLEYKRAALAFKKLGQLDKAREMLAISKSIQSAISSGTVNFELPPSLQLPGSAGSPVTELVTTPKSIDMASPKSLELQKDTGIAKNDAPINRDTSMQQTEAVITQVAQAVDQISGAGSCEELLNHLESTLESQIQLCTRLSAQYFTAGEKEKALEFHKRKKALIQDKETLNAFKKIPLNPSNLPFSFSYTTLEYFIAQTHTDVGLDELELSIIKGSDIVVKDVNEIESGVAYDFGWPFSAAGTNPEGKGDTSIKKGANPEFMYRRLIKIERTKGFQRFLERKKATFEVFYMSKSLFGMLAKRVTIGKIILKLDDLLSKREIHQVMDVNNPRKATGGKIEIKIRMRAPLIKADIAKNSDKWLVLSFGQANAVISKRTSETLTASIVPNADVNENKPARKEIQLGETKSATAINASATNLNEEAENEEYILNFLNPDLIASNQVLEHEHANIVKKIAESKTPQEDLLDLKNSYEIKMNMLVTSIQIGALDMPMYLKQVKDAMALSKQQALHFKKIGKMDLASQALVRLKLMAAEVKEVEEPQ
ncbi:Coiled-coil and C2 domain-containing protein 1B [Terramyces sp. JEL0728]|nr:Coiled-coil and C2 domain-containing protein 1B [Terramyces sp. JEL0728]